MISGDIKTDVKQEIKKLVAVSYNFSQMYLLKTCSWHSMQPIYCPLRMGNMGVGGRGGRQSRGGGESEGAFT